MPVQEMTAEEFFMRNIHHDLGEYWEVIDVREPWEYELVHIPHTKNIPLSTLMEKTDEALKQINFDKKVVILCRTGGRSAHAADVISEHAEDEIYNFMGGMASVYEKFSTDVIVTSSTDSLKDYFE